MLVSKKRCVAMLLAGGQGSRLGVLTRYRAKPAVPFGGKYRIIDFPLSNCANSGLDTIGVLTQYQPLELNTYIGTGASWDLDSINGGAFVLPPYLAGSTGEWYSGTANAIFQNIFFVDRYEPDYLLVLSGDHIYKMDYTRMLDFHSRHQADATIAVLRVPLSEASRFGILNTDADYRVVEFDEKPSQPKNDLASMGIYVFNWGKLKEYLQADADDAGSDHDFGKNVLPAMLAGGERMFAYPFEGYWKDVGTADSLWEANMELLGASPQIEPGDPAWKIYAHSANQPPHYAAAGSDIRTSLVSEGCEIYGSVEHSVLFPGVRVGEGAVVKDSVVMAGTDIGPRCRVEHTIIDENARVEEGAVVGGPGLITVVGSGAVIGGKAVVDCGCWIEPEYWLSAKEGE